MSKLTHIDETGRARMVAIDPTTVAMLRRRRDTAEAVADELRIPLPASGYVFSAVPGGGKANPTPVSTVRTPLLNSCSLHGERHDQANDPVS